MRTCSIEDCENKVRTRGYCVTHYGRYWRGTVIDAPVNRRGLVKECTVSWCDRKVVGRGLCIGHWHRWNEGRDLAPPFRLNKKPPIHKICPTCEKAFTVSPSGAHRVHCSRKCWGKSRTGARNSHWKGGITGADSEERNRFAREIRELVFARDNYTCQICQTENSGRLQVDHIKQWSKFPELRFELANCRTVCVACHYYIHFKRKMPIGIVWGRLKCD